MNEVHQGKVETHNREFENITLEQKNLTTMMDNLYMDKLKGRITESEYDRFYTSLREKATELTVRLEQLQEAEENYFITAKCVLKVVNRAYELFLSSKVEEKRQLIKLILSNLRLDGEKIVWDVQKPFDLIIKTTDSKRWRG